MRLNTVRDDLIEAVLARGHGIDAVCAITKLAREIETARRADQSYAKCPRCWDFHKVWLNFGHLPEEIAASPLLAREHLCDDCQKIILQDFPNHPGVPHIRAAMIAQRDKFTVKS